MDNKYIAYVTEALLPVRDCDIEFVFSILMEEENVTDSEIISWLAMFPEEILEELYEHFNNIGDGDVGGIMDLLWQAMADHDEVFEWEGECDPLYEAYRSLEKEFISSHEASWKK